MNDVDITKAHITLQDGSVWQVLNDDGDFDEAETALAVDAYLRAQRDGNGS